MASLAPSYLRRSLVEPQPPPTGEATAMSLVRARLFDRPSNVALTVVSAVVAALLVWPTIRFLFIDAVWHGASRVDCLPETVGHEVGACWPFIAAKFRQFMYGFYPESEQWRVNLTYLLGVILLVPLLVPRLPHKGTNAVLFFGVFPLVGFFLLVGGAFGLPHVETRLWGGLLVTLVISFTGIVFSLPLGILLALGRRSDLPIVRMLSVIFIEFWRGVPLITVLFFATYMLPLFLPESWKIDPLVAGACSASCCSRPPIWRRSCAADCRPSRAGSSRPRWRLGLAIGGMTGLIVLPQALKLVIPGIVNSFIALFKDTTLVLIVAIFDLLGQLRAAFADPSWATPVTLFTGFAFAGMIYFVFCFAMSRYALFVERRLNTGRARRPSQLDDRTGKQSLPRMPHHPQRDCGRDRRPQQMVRRFPRAARHRPHGRCAASAS